MSRKLFFLFVLLFLAVVNYSFDVRLAVAEHPWDDVKHVSMAQHDPCEHLIRALVQEHPWDTLSVLGPRDDGEKFKYPWDDVKRIPVPGEPEEEHPWDDAYPDAWQ